LSLGSAAGGKGGFRSALGTAQGLSGPSLLFDEAGERGFAFCEPAIRLRQNLIKAQIAIIARVESTDVVGGCFEIIADGLGLIEKITGAVDNARPF